MKKQIPTYQEVVEFGKTKGIKEEYMRSRLMQNAIEISTDILSEMQDISGFGRDMLFNNYIEPWTREAEMRWYNSDECQNCEYIEFVQKFAQEKLKEFKEEISPLHEVHKKRKAKLVMFTLTTRVVVDANEMPECEEEDAIDKALEKIKANPEDYLIANNFEDMYDDEECPYGTFVSDSEE